MKFIQKIIDLVLSLGSLAMSLGWLLGWSVVLVFTVSCGSGNTNKTKSVGADDTAPPTVTLGNVIGPLRGGQTVNLQFSAKDNNQMSGLRLYYARDGVSFSEVSEQPDVGATTIAWVVPTDNTSSAKLRLAASDAARNVASRETAAFAIDSTPPAPPVTTLRSSRHTNQRIVRLSLANCTDLTQVIVGEGEAPTLDATGWIDCKTFQDVQYTLSNSTVRERAVRVWGRDEVGNMSTGAKIDVYYDATPPVLSIDTVLGRIAGGSYQLIEATLNEDSTATTVTPSIEYSEDNGFTWHTLGNLQVVSQSESEFKLQYAWTNVPMINSTQVKLQAGFVDQAGNVGFVVGSPFTVDAEAPTISLNDVAGPVRGGDSLSLGLSATDNMAALTRVALYYAENGIDFTLLTDQLTDADNSFNWTAPTVDTPNARLKLEAVDHVGNRAEVETASFYIDSTPPGAPAIILQSDPYVNTTEIALTMQNCNSIKELFLSEAPQAPSGTAVWTPCTTTVGAITFSLQNQPQGLRTVYVWGRDDAGNATPSRTVFVTMDTVAPVLVFTAVPPATRGAETLTFEFSITELNVDSSSVIEFWSSLDNGASWSKRGTTSLSQGIYEDTRLQFAWDNVPSANSDQVRLRLTTEDLAGNQTSIDSVALTIDSEAPNVTAIEVNHQDQTARNNNLHVTSLVGKDNFRLADVCLKYNDNVEPARLAPCWRSLQTPPFLLGNNSDLNVDDATNFYFQVGLGKGEYKIYAWVRDEAGNVSPLTGPNGLNRAVITYDPGDPPTISHVEVQSTNVDETVRFDLYWTATDDNSTQLDVNVYYRTSGEDWLPISQAQGLTNAENNGCSLAQSSHTGCVRLLSPTSDAFQLMLRAADTDGMTAQARSVLINSSAFQIIGGNTDPGIGGSATSGVFKHWGLHGTSGGLAVSSAGVIYFRDRHHGIFRIAPDTGIQELYLRTTGVSSGDGGAATAATVANPVRIDIDFQDRLLILDRNRIRRVDAQGTIDTIIGGGNQLTVPVGGIDARQAALTAFQAQFSNQFFMAVLPNGDIYFNPTANAKTKQVWRYTEATGRIEAVHFTGTQNLGGVVLDVEDSAYAFGRGPVGLRYDTDTSEVSDFLAIGLQSSHRAWTRFNASGVAEGPHPSGLMTYISYSTGQNGELYAVTRSSTQLYHFNAGTLTWEVIGNRDGGTGDCADNTPVLDCKMEPRSIFVNRQGRIYFYSRGRIRVVDDSGRVQTLAGQPMTFGDGGVATSARFNVINDIGYWIDNSGVEHVAVLDRNEYKIREFEIGGTMQSIAGNGALGAQEYGADALNEPLALGEMGAHVYDLMTVNSKNGHVYFHRGGKKTLAELNRTTGQWVEFQGGGSIYYADAQADGSADIRFGGYPSKAIGFNAVTDTLAIATIDWSGSALVNSLFKTYDLATKTQAHLLGNVGPGQLDNGALGRFCSGNAGASECDAPKAYGFNVSAQSLQDTSWLMHRSGTALLKRSDGQNASDFAILPTNALSFAYDETSDRLFYCQADTRRIYQFERTPNAPTPTGTGVELPWPIESMKCAGYRMFYSKTRESLIFPVEQDHVMGVGEYAVPTGE